MPELPAHLSLGACGSTQSAAQFPSRDELKKLAERLAAEQAQQGDRAGRGRRGHLQYQAKGDPWRRYIVYFDAADRADIVAMR